jgi:hypothetical protein
MPDETYRVIITKTAEIFTVAADPVEAKLQAENYSKRIAVAKRTTHGQVDVSSGDAVKVS